MPKVEYKFAKKKKNNKCNKQEQMQFLSKRFSLAKTVGVGAGVLRLRYV